MTGVPCIELTWETFEKYVIPNYGTIFENETTVWAVKHGFLLIANKPKDKCGSYEFLVGSIPAIGFSNFWTK